MQLRATAGLGVSGQHVVERLDASLSRTLQGLARSPRQFPESRGRPSEKAATATSSAALNTAGAVPPARPAA